MANGGDLDRIDALTESFGGRIQTGGTEHGARHQHNPTEALALS